MSKLLMLKEWLTLGEASRYLSGLCEEPLSEADILRLALDGHLTLSVRFVNHAHARVGPVVRQEEAETYKVQLGENDWFMGFEGLFIGDGRVVELCRLIDTLDGVWDLAMLGAERLDVEHRYQRLTGGPAVELVCLEGPIVCREDVYAQIQASFRDNEFFDKANMKSPWMHPDNWYPAGCLPNDSVLVVRTKALAEFKLKLSEHHALPDPGALAKESTRKGGRPMSSQWPAWIAELVALIHDEGVPPGSGSQGGDELISRVADRLAAQGSEGPTRTTVQETIRTVLRRLRCAGN